MIKIKKEIYDKYNGVSLKDLQHIGEISWYCNNYYIGETYFKEIKDLIFAKSDDDNTTDLYLTNGVNNYLRFAQCFTSEKDVIRVLENNEQEL